jgi:hypothetical protein
MISLRRQIRLLGTDIERSFRVLATAMHQMGLPSPAVLKRRTGHGTTPR